MKPIQIRLVGRFRFISKLSGEHEHLLYQGLHTQTNQPLFLKGEQYKARPNDGFLNILQQGKILQIMQGGTGIPHMHWCGQQQDYNFIALEELGQNLDTLLRKCENRFTLKTVYMIADDIITILQYFHFKNFCHNQLNPHNFLLGQGEKCFKLYLVDYGGATRFKDNTSSEHIAEESTQKKMEARFINLEFSSIRYNRGENVARKDDLQSMIYLMLFLLKGQLPWSQMVKNDKKSKAQRARSVLKMKTTIPIEELFEGYPDLLMLFKYLNSLAFDEKPRYTYFKTVFKQRIQKVGQIFDKIYDWLLIEDCENCQDIEIKFEIIPNENQFIKQLTEEMKVKENGEKKKEAQRTEQILSPRSAKQKDCIIY